ncbi:hypothetical protein ACQW02_05095 [Humitalea sp. 24SJ18S-53]|uniref:hypothetical protein n=1 Tax=Humitalea sp. 24SJ18S-53 TaxID=3422307 RepID=UPI003D666324
MTGLTASPRVIKGGLVLLDPATAAVRRVIALQYNPDNLTRTLTAQTPEAQGQSRAEALRLRGPAVETLRVEVELDATDRLHDPDRNAAAVAHGLFPDLAAMEILAYPESSHLQSNAAQAAQGNLEIAPMEAPLCLFIWSRNRVVPVRLTEFSVTEEAFDSSLNPIRAKVTLAMRVLTVDDLGFAHRGSGLFMGYLQNKERLAGLASQPGLAALGLSGLP